jgi:MYXO-CTERM domain-containing protein
MKLRTILVIISFFAILPLATRATTTSYNLDGCTDSHACSGDVGSTTANYTSNGQTITATSFSSPGHDLYIKTEGGDESGLGITGTSDNEIESGAFIQLDFSNLANAGATSGFLTLDSVQSGEGYKVCASSSAASDSGTCLTGSLDDTAFAIDFSKSAPFIDISSTTGDVLVSSASVDSPASVDTPEPSSMALALLGLAGLAFMAIRRSPGAISA